MTLKDLNTKAFRFLLQNCFCTGRWNIALKSQIPGHSFIAMIIIIIVSIIMIMIIIITWNTVSWLRLLALVCPPLSMILLPVDTAHALRNGHHHDYDGDDDDNHHLPHHHHNITKYLAATSGSSGPSDQVSSMEFRTFELKSLSWNHHPAKTRRIKLSLFW